MGVFCFFRVWSDNMSTFFFKDFGKSTKDIIEKDVPTNEQLKVNTNYNNVKLAFTGKTKGRVAEGVFEPTWNMKDYGVELKGSFKTGGEISMTGTLNDKLTKGLKLNANFVTSTTGKQQKFETSAEYKYQNKAAVTAKVAFPSSTTAVKADFSAVAFRNQWAFGAALATQFNEQMTGAPDVVSVGVQYNALTYNASSVLHRSGAGDISGEFRYFKACGKHSVGSEMKINHSTGDIVGALALATKMDSGAVSKIVFGSNGCVGFSWKKRIDSNTNVTLGCKANTATKQYEAGLNIEVDL